MGLSSHEPVLLSAESMAPGVDFNLLLRATAQLLPHLPDVRLVIFVQRDDPAYAPIKSAIARHSIKDHVVISFDTSREDWMAASDVGVVMSHADGHSPHVLACMAAGLPVVAVNAGGNSELIRHGESGYLVDFTDTDQLAMYITVLLLSPELAERFGQAGRDRVARDHSYERATRQRSDYFYALTHMAVS